MAFDTKKKPAANNISLGGGQPNQQILLAQGLNFVPNEITEKPTEKVNESVKIESLNNSVGFSSYPLIIKNRTLYFIFVIGIIFGAFFGFILMKAFYVNEISILLRQCIPFSVILK